MNIKRKRRLYTVIAIVIGVSAAISLSLYALGQEVDLYVTPTQALTQHFNAAQDFRLGGIVKQGSFYRVPHTTRVHFVLTDNRHQLTVKYSGVLPVLFRVGQGIVVQGHFNQQGIFIANQVLAKHDAKYMPPGIKKRRRHL